ncbi:MULTISPECIES: 2-oxo-4-hydroxy-4-carboxy-5-ureidoimidazoline decarboxylase [Cupriavidus]|uniref:2-oxo-4-hydroxy-4-carboxy-5-ureidoimidazoline decarboxylase n=1 Tax=Cupriavidus sp. WS TaxID=1312922 RepID=UPI00037DE29A|nr:2-oxo-4-hydroxy-4-carboxy-5-ureidoimidazoline decarboxylase [Cupriavidus sp. WS]
MSQTYTLGQLNALPAAGFVQVLGGIYEHSPWVAEAAAAKRPFADIATLADTMRAIVDGAGGEAQVRLVRAHPELAGKAAVRGELTAESTREQSGAGLDQCSAEEFERLQDLNRRYNARFGFPFILAVRGYDRAGIIGEFARRVGNEPAAELQTCINQIHRIAQFRLDDLVSR